MKLKVLGSMAVSSVFLTSCATFDLQTIMGNGSAVSTYQTKLTPTKENRVKLYFGNQRLPKHHRIIGHVTADHYNIAAIPFSQDSIASELKKQAATIGATGVMNITTGFDRTSGDAIISK